MSRENYQRIQSSPLAWSNLKELLTALAAEAGEQFARTAATAVFKPELRTEAARMFGEHRAYTNMLDDMKRFGGETNG
jgi:hypothetical protein